MLISFRKKEVLSEGDKILKEKAERRLVIETEKQRQLEFHRKNNAAKVIQRAFRRLVI